jgi:hypothetical protein
MSRVFVVSIAVALVVLAAGAASATYVRWNGGLGFYGNGLGLQAEVGVAYSFGMGHLSAGGSSARIERVRLHGAPSGIALVGSVVSRRSLGLGIAQGFPPRGDWVPVASIRPARDSVVPAHHWLDLAIGLRAVRPGRFRISGVDVLYRLNWHGIELRRRAHVGSEIVVCAPKPCQYSA